jgi:hypothetical protein
MCSQSLGGGRTADVGKEGRLGDFVPEVRILDTTLRGTYGRKYLRTPYYTVLSPFPRTPYSSYRYGKGMPIMRVQSLNKLIIRAKGVCPIGGVVRPLFSWFKIRTERTENEGAEQVSVYCTENLCTVLRTEVSVLPTEYVLHSKYSVLG